MLTKLFKSRFGDCKQIPQLVNYKSEIVIILKLFKEKFAYERLKNSYHNLSSKSLGHMTC